MIVVIYVVIYFLLLLFLLDLLFSSRARGFKRLAKKYQLHYTPAPFFTMDTIKTRSISGNLNGKKILIKDQTASHLSFLFSGSYNSRKTFVYIYDKLQNTEKENFWISLIPFYGNFLSFNKLDKFLEKIGNNKIN